MNYNFQRVLHCFHELVLSHLPYICCVIAVSDRIEVVQIFKLQTNKQTKKCRANLKVKIYVLLM